MRLKTGGVVKLATGGKEQGKTVGIGAQGVEDLSGAPRFDDLALESEARYYTLEEGTCCCPKGQLIETKAECELALQSLYTGKNASIHWEGDTKIIPGGCSWRNYKHHDGRDHGRGHWNEEKAGSARFDQVPICKARASGPWVVGPPRASCTSTCATHGLACDWAHASMIETFQTLSEKISELLNISCTDGGGQWVGNPSYDPETNECYYGRPGRLPSECDMSEEHPESKTRRLCYCPPKPYCLRIVTGKSKYNDGYVSVKVDGAVLKEESHWGRGKVVADVCYETPISSVHVKNSRSNAWGGSIEYSSDSGANFSPMLCTKGCNKVGSASNIAVDADKKNGMTASVKCLEANWCELTQVNNMTGAE